MLLRRILFAASVFVLGASTSAQAEILASPSIWGGGSQSQAVCYISNFGTGPVTILSREVIRIDGVKPSISTGCGAVGAAYTLAVNASCGFYASPINVGLPHACKVIVSDGSNVRGGIEIRPATNNSILQRADMTSQP